MNEHLKLSKVGLDLISSFEGAPRTRARLCEGGRWELSYGCTTWPPDETGYARPIAPTDTCTHEQAMQLFDYHLDRFEKAVRNLVTVPLTQYQFDALVSFTYNIGEGYGPGEGFEDSSVLRETNKGNWREAANVWGAHWIHATKTAAQRNADEPVEWYTSPDGQPCPYRRALRGLLRRRLAEACVYMGADWKQACNDNDQKAITLTAERSWNSKRRRNEDQIPKRTEFAEVWETARHFPLPPPDELVLSDPIKLPTELRGAPATQPSAGGPAPPQSVSQASVGAPVAAGEKQATGVSPSSTPAPAAPVGAVKAGEGGTKPASPFTVQPNAVSYKIDPEAGLKPLDTSDRAKGYVFQQVGIAGLRVASMGAFGSGVATVTQAVEKDIVLTQTAQMFFAVGGVALAAFLVKKYGDWKRKRGEQKASQALV